MRCYTYKGEFIPQCWGAVRHGKDGCYCYTRQYTDLEMRIVELEETVMRLKDERDALLLELGREAILG